MKKLKIYNTLTRKKEVFKPLKENKVNFYSCGPTVYNFAHIGNLRTYVMQDLLLRTLKYIGYDVFYLENLTDVDDKTIRDYKKESDNIKDFTEKYTKYYKDDLDKLNITHPDKFVKATDTIDKMTEQIQILLDKGYAYLSDDNCIYYDISKFKNYGDFANLDLKGLKTNARIKNDEYEKDNLADFVLWKAWTDKDKDVYWNVDFKVDGKIVTIKGRPGWHSECSAIVSKEFNDNTIDIHSGGVDLIFPHHQNEIAIFEAINNKQFVKYWIHPEHLLVDNTKMSKKLGNFYTLRDIEKMGYTGRDLRLLYLSAHYKQKLNLTKKSLIQAKNTLIKIDNFIKNIIDITKEGVLDKDINTKCEDLMDKFEDSLLDDLNTPKIFSYIFDFIRYINSKKDINKQDIQKILEVMKKINKVLDIMKFKFDKLKIPKKILDLIEKRSIAKKNNNFKLADRIRDDINSMGYNLIDTPERQKVEKRL